MKILSLTNCSLDAHLGSGKTVSHFTDGLRKLGHSVELLEPNGYEWWPSFGRARQYRQAAGAWALIGQKLRTERYDLIEFYGGEFGFAVQRASQWDGHPVLVAHTNGLELLDKERERHYNPPKNPINRFSRKILEHMAHRSFTGTDAFVSLCESDHRFVLDAKLYPAERTAVVNPGLDLEFCSLPFTENKQDRIAFTGTWIPRKGVEKLTAVMEKVLGRYAGLRLDLYGTHMSPGVILSGFSPGVRNRIVIHPLLSGPRLAEELLNIKVFFFPSQYEGFGIALAEAMACSCAVVATPTGFSADLEDGAEAILCGFEDEAAMESALLRLLRDDTLRTRIARNGWARTRALGWESSCSKLASTYLRWVDESNRHL